jgi:hypothetical protein
MNKIYFNFIVICMLVFVATAVLADDDDDVKLHTYYEQNGECFILIGDGAQRAVWALNNLASGKKPEAMYDPYDAYGIVAAQKWNASTNKAEKDLFTFASNENAKTSLKGTKQPRRIVMTASTAVYSGTPPATVHRYHTAPNAGPTGRGNHTTTYITRLFGGTDYPCNVIPDAVATMPGYHWYPVGTGFYHAHDVVVWSNYTYRSSGGYCRRMLRENLSGVYRDLKLYKYRVGSSKNVADLQNNVAKVLTKVTGTMDMNGECCDGCIAKVDGAAMPDVESPHLSCVYSAIVDRSYLYRRDYGAPSYTLLGNTSDDTTIGNGADLTCEHIGISSKSATGNYVYFLGKNEINKWMEASKVPEAMKLRQLTDVAVSDQWWQTGGIVYAYDKSKGKVYSFVRKEDAASGAPDEIDVNDGGILPDAIGADGFGSLYMLKTEYNPPNKSYFKDGNEESTADTGLVYGPTGQKIFKAVYKQEVNKSVYKRAYDTGRTAKEKNSILIGKNTYERRYVTEDNKIDSEKSWLDDFIQIAPIISDAVRVELAVINSPTPPRPTNINAVTDCIGPMTLSSIGFSMATPGKDDGFSSDQDLYFLVENAPYFDANDLNVGSVGEDVDRDGRIGRFPNTISKDHIKYYWKIIRTHDREGGKVDETDPANTLLDTEGNYLLSFPSNLEGQFKVGVKVTYGYYDYSQLPVGALASAKDTVLVTGRGASGEDGAGYSWETIKMTLVPKILNTNDKGVLMAGTSSKVLATYKPGAGLPSFGCGTSCGHAVCAKTEQAPDTMSFIMDGHSLVRNSVKDAVTGDYDAVYNDTGVIDWGMRVRETKYNVKRGIDRVASMTSLLPPEPNDPQLVPGTLRWENKLQVTWKSELKQGNEILFTDEVIGEEPYLNLDQLRRLMPVPSEPLRYKISVTMSRKYMYEYYNLIPKYVGGVFTGSYDYLRVPKSVSMDIWAEAEVCVTDNTPPSPFVYNAAYVNTDEKIIPGYAVTKPVLYGTTGELINNAQNAGNIDFIVVDNNPMAAYTGASVLKQGDTDLYHYGGTTYNRLRVNFNSANREAILNYTIGANSIPIKTDPVMVEHYRKKPTVPTQAEVEAAGLTYSKALSYHKYTYPVTVFQHCSKRLDDLTQWSAGLPINYATNTPGYQNYLFGIEWRESCTGADNDLSVEAQKTGHIVVKDNDRPNVAISAVQDKYPDETFYAPSGLSAGQMPPNWVVTLLDEHSGPEDWFKNDGGPITDYFKFLNVKTPVNTSLFTTNMPLEVDIPVVFEALVSDNSGAANIIMFRLEDEGGNLLYDATSPSKRPLQYVFRRGGKYKLVLEVEDDALAWPAANLAMKDPKKADFEPNKRKLVSVFEVKATKLEFRIIERKNRND